MSIMAKKKLKMPKGYIEVENKEDRQYNANGQRKRKKGKTTIYKILCRKQKSEQHEHQ